MVGVLQVLVTQRPEATTALLMQLCTAAEAGEDQWVAQVANFTHLYDERCARSCTYHVQQCAFLMRQEHLPALMLSTPVSR